MIRSPAKLGGPVRSGRFDQDAHLKDYYGIVKRRKWAVILSFFTIVILVTAFSFIASPIYRATSEILVERLPPPALDGGKAITPESFSGQEFLHTQCDLLRSRTLAAMVISKLGLSDMLERTDPEQLNRVAERLRTAAHGFFERITGKASVGVRKTGNRSFHSAAPAKGQGNGIDLSGAGGASATPYNINPRAIDSYLRKLKIEQVRKSSLVNISFSSRSRRLSANVVNAHVKAFIERNAKTNRMIADHTLRWLESQLQEQKQRVEASQFALYTYKVSNNITSFNGPDNIASERVRALSAALTQVEEQKIRKQLVYNQSLDEREIASLPESIQNRVVQQLRSQLTVLESKQAQLASRFKADFPMMAGINSQVAKLRHEITAELHRQKNAIKSELNRADKLEAAIRKQLDVQKKIALSVSQKAIKYDILKRNVEMNQKVYDVLLKQAKEIALISGLERGAVSVVDKAEVPLLPVRPRIVLNVLASIFLGLLAGIGLALFLEYMDNTVGRPEEVMSLLGVPVLGLIPSDKALLKDQDVLPAPDLESPVPKLPGYEPHALADISNRLMIGSRADAPAFNNHVYVVESATAGEGKTTVLCKLAVKLAQAGLRVSMIDCDIFRPMLHKVFKLQDAEGLSEIEKSLFAHEIGSGTLGEYSVDDLFFLIQLRKQSGRLVISRDSQSMHASFSHGQLLHLQDMNNPESNRLGSMLHKGGVISAEQLHDSLERNQRTGFPLGYILVSSGYVTHDRLQGPLRLQTEEHLHKLFSWRHGRFKFDQAQMDIGKGYKLYFRENYLPVIRDLALISGSCFLKGEVLRRVHPLRNPNLCLMPLTAKASNHNRCPDLHFMEKMLDILKQYHDVILIDAPPLLSLSGITPISALADGVIFVIRDGRISFTVINQAKDTLDQAGAKVIGAILNQVRGSVNSYYSYH